MKGKLVYDDDMRAESERRLQLEWKMRCGKKKKRKGDREREKGAKKKKG